jgi:hypothetical protein
VQLFSDSQGRWAHRASATPVRYRIRAALVVVQIALSVVLSLRRLDASVCRSSSRRSAFALIDISRFDRDPRTALSERGSRHAFSRNSSTGLRDTGHGAPSTIFHTTTCQLGVVMPGPTSRATRRLAETREAPSADTRAISRLFETLGVRVIEGRFHRRDDAEAAGRDHRRHAGA